MAAIVRICFEIENWAIQKGIVLYGVLRGNWFERLQH
jgi:hypothetical protein